MYKIPRILTNSITYTFFNVLQKAISFFLLPLYTIYLTPDDYGIINVLTSATALLSFFYTFSIQSASSRFNFKYSKDKILVKKIWGCNLLFIILNSILWCLLSILLYKYTLIYLIGNDIKFNPYVLICLLNCSIAPIFHYYQVYLQANQKAFHFAINSFIHFLVTLVLNIAFVVVFHMKALGVLYATLITTILFCVYSILYLYKHVTINWSIKILKRSLSYSIPLLPHTLSGWLNGMLDRIFINKIINLSSVGLYSIAYQFGFVINMLAYGVNQAYTPWFFKNYKSIEGKNRIILLVDFIILGIACISFFVVIFSREILQIMTNVKYHSVWPTIVILIYANLFNSLYYFYVATLFLERTKNLSMISISCAIFNSIINYLLISKYGYIGAAYSYLIVQFFTSLLVYIFAKKMRPDIKYNGSKHYLELMALMMIITPLLYININNLFILVMYKLFLFTFVVFWLLLCNKQTLKKIKYEFKK